MPRRKRKVARQAERGAANPFQRRIQILWRNLVLFLILFIVSLVLFFFTTTGSVFYNLFELLFIIFGFIALALLIVLVIVLIIKSGKK